MHAVLRHTASQLRQLCSLIMRFRTLNACLERWLGSSVRLGKSECWASAEGKQPRRATRFRKTLEGNEVQRSCTKGGGAAIPATPCSHHRRPRSRYQNYCPSVPKCRGVSPSSHPARPVAKPLRYSTGPPLYYHPNTSRLDGRLVGGFSWGDVVVCQHVVQRLVIGNIEPLGA